MPGSSRCVRHLPHLHVNLGREVQQGVIFGVVEQVPVVPLSSPRQMDSATKLSSSLSRCAMGEAMACGLQPKLTQAF